MFEHVRQYENFRADCLRLRGRLSEYVRALKYLETFGEDDKDTTGGGAVGAMTTASATGTGGGEGLLLSQGGQGNQFSHYPKGAVVGSASGELRVAKSHDGIHHYFKTSKQKKRAAVAAVATNLQVHTATFRRVHGSGGGSGDNDGGGNGDNAVRVSSITFGAPSAHALGFKLGGVRQTHAALVAEIDQRSKKKVGDKIVIVIVIIIDAVCISFSWLLVSCCLCSSDRRHLHYHSSSYLQARTLEAQSRLLQLKFLVHVRTTLVVAQAFAAAAAGAVDVLGACFDDAQRSGAFSRAGAQGRRLGEQEEEEEVGTWVHTTRLPRRRRAAVSAVRVVRHASTYLPPHHGGQGGWHDRRLQRSGKRRRRRCYIYSSEHFPLA